MELPDPVGADGSQVVVAAVSQREANECKAEHPQWQRRPRWAAARERSRRGGPRSPPLRRRPGRRALSPGGTACLAPVCTTRPRTRTQLISSSDAAMIRPSSRERSRVDSPPRRGHLEKAGCEQRHRDEIAGVRRRRERRPLSKGLFVVGGEGRAETQTARPGRAASTTRSLSRPTTPEAGSRGSEGGQREGDVGGGEPGSGAAASLRTEQNDRQGGHDDTNDGRNIDEKRGAPAPRSHHGAPIGNRPLPLD